MRNPCTLIFSLALAGIFGQGPVASASEAGIVLVHSFFSEGGCDSFGGCGNSLWSNRLQLSGESLADVKLCDRNERLTLTWSNPFDQTLPILDMPTENNQSRSVREDLQAKGQATVTGSTGASLEGVCVELLDGGGNRLARTVLHAVSPALSASVPNPNCECVSRPNGSIDLVRVRDGKVLWTYASDIWPMDVCIADRESLPECR